MSKISVVIFLLLIIFYGLHSHLYSQEAKEVSSPHKTLSKSNNLQTYTPGVILVKTHSNAINENLDAMNKALHTETLEIIPKSGIVKLKTFFPVALMVDLAQSQPFVEYAYPNYILAEVGDQFITAMDLVRYLGQLPSFVQLRLSNDESKKTLLKTLVRFKVFAKAAKEENLHKKPHMQELLSAAIEITLAKDYQKRLIRTTSFSEKELKEFYERHLKEFQRPEQIKVSLIVTETENEAKEILDMIKNGADFKSIAREKSIDASAQYGGELGWTGRGRFGQAFDTAAFSLSQGQVSDIIETEHGYSIIKLDDKKGPEPQPFEEVREKIKLSLQIDNQTEIIEKRSKELTEKYKVILHEEFLSEVSVQPKGSTKDRNLGDLLQKLQGEPTMPSQMLR